jgi:hypothetical protein
MPELRRAPCRALARPRRSVAERSAKVDDPVANVDRWHAPVSSLEHVALRRRNSPFDKGPAIGVRPVH